MDLREKIVMTLVTNLDYVYCDTCRNQNKEICDSCAISYKKNGWGISYEVAEKIADKILGGHND